MNITSKVRILFFFGLFAPSLCFGLTVTPSNISVSGKPGETIQTMTTVTNDSSAALSLDFSARTTTADINGSPIIGEYDGEAKWIQGPSSLKIEAGEKKEIPLSVLIPVNTKPGGYAVIGLFSDKNSTIPASTGANILINVEGESIKEEVDAQLSLRDRTILIITLTNKGDSHLHPGGSIDMINNVGSSDWRTSFNDNPSSGYLLAHATREYAVSLPKIDMYAAYTVKLSLTYGKPEKTIFTEIQMPLAWSGFPEQVMKDYVAEVKTSKYPIEMIGEEIFKKLPLSLSSCMDEDRDKDGLSDGLEYVVGSNPEEKDTDKDGFTDAEEVEKGYNPLGSGKAEYDPAYGKSRVGYILLYVQKDKRASLWATDEKSGQVKYCYDGSRNGALSGLGVSDRIRNFINAANGIERITALKKNITKYENADLGYSLQYPAKWTKEMTASPQTIFLWTGKSIVTLSWQDTKRNLKDLSSDQVNFSKKYFKDKSYRTVLGPKNISVGGSNGMTYEYTYKKDTSTMRGIETGWVYGGKGYSISASVPVKDFPQLKKELTTLFASIGRL